MKLWCIANTLQTCHQERSTKNLGAAEELLNFFCRLLKDLITDFRVQGNNNNNSNRRLLAAPCDPPFGTASDGVLLYAPQCWLEMTSTTRRRRRRRREHRVARTWLSDHSFFWVRVRDREIEIESEREGSQVKPRERERGSGKADRGVRRQRHEGSLRKQSYGGLRQRRQG